MRIKSHAPLMYVGMSVAGFITLGMIGLFIVGMRGEGRDTWFFYVAMAPFLLVGALLVYFGIRFLQRMARWGSWQLEGPDHGLAFGKPHDVTLFPTRERTPTGELTCQLRCIRITRHGGTGSGGHRTTTTTVWETTWTIAAPGLIRPALGMPIRLPLPDQGLPTAMDKRTASGIQWQLNVLIPSAGMSEEPVFDLPVRVRVIT